MVIDHGAPMRERKLPFVALMLGLIAILLGAIFWALWRIGNVMPSCDYGPPGLY